MKIIVTKRPPPNKYPGTDLDRYQPKCPYCAEIRDHATLLWRAARSFQPQARTSKGIEELDTSPVFDHLFRIRCRRFKCHTCGCEWKVRK